MTLSEAGVCDPPADEILPSSGHGRTAFYLPSQGEPLFAWLRVPKAGGRHGVIVCNPMGYEQIHCHRSLRHLAEELADAGFPTLSFDYHGTGDSPGTDEDPDRIETWRRNIQDAILWIRAELGCEKITLIGLRLGASLAVLAATRQAVDQLVLWAPVVIGRQFARELKALSATGAGGNAAPPGGQGAIESAGFTVGGQTLRDIEKIDLRAERPPCSQALIVARDDLPADTRLRDHFVAAGLPCDQVAAPGYADMLALPHFSQVPTRAIEEIIHWLTDAGESAAAPAPPSTLGHGPIPLTSVTHSPPGGGVVERPLQLSSDPNLFGILSGPGRRADPALPLVLLLNGGSAYRVGPNRLNVQMARGLSAAGFRCLRMDICGLGDSVAADPAVENHSYPGTALRDLDIAVKYLAGEMGVKQVVLLGLCSGGYNAFRAAARLANPAIVESVVINPLTFFWRDGMSYEIPELKRIHDLNYYFRAAARPQNWLRLLFGNTQIGFRGAFRMALGYTRDRCRAEAVPPAPSEAIAGPAEEENIPRDLASIAGRRRKLSFFFASSEPGHSLLLFAARRSVNRLRRTGQLRIAVIDDADHTFSSSVSRRQLIGSVTKHLRSRYSLGLN